MKRFLLGFAIGATASAAIVLATTPRSGTETRQQLANTYAYARQRINEKVQTALSEGRTAATAREQELWSEFHRRVDNGKQKEE
jgi:gas vesicle protein